MAKVMREFKNITKGYSCVQVKVREATSNDPWGPTGTQMSEIAQITFNGSTEFYEVMDMLDKRLNDKGKNWRHVLKALKVMDYCLHEGSELVVSWAKQNIFIIKTLREFQYIDEDGRDVGHNVRIAAKELTSLILDEEKLRSERSDRRAWKSRVTGLEEERPPMDPPSRRQRPRQTSDEDDVEYRLAIEASKAQEEEDRRKRQSRSGEDDDDDLAKAIKLSKEEDERRRRELEENNVTSLFDDEPVRTSQPQLTGFNQGYTQGNPVDFFANPIGHSQMQSQQTGYVGNAYTGFQQPQPTGFQNGYSNTFGPQSTGFDPYSQQQMQSQSQSQPPPFQQQPTGFNPYVQQQALSPVPEPSLHPGSNNPWSSSNNQAALKPMPTGSNNPFAQQPTTRPQTSFKASGMNALGSLPEKQTLSTFSQPSFSQTSAPFGNQQQPQPQKELSEHEARLNSLLASGDGTDTFGNTGQLRIPAQHTAPGTFVNSAGAGLTKLTSQPTANNPFLRQQFTGMPTVSYGGQQMPAATGPVGMTGFGAQGANNPFAGRQQQQQNSQGDLIQF